MAKEDEVVIVNADISVDDFTESKEDHVSRVGNRVATVLSAMRVHPKDEQKSLFKGNAIAISDITETETRQMQQGIHPEHVLGRLSAMDGDRLQKFLKAEFGIVVPGTMALLNMSGELNRQYPDGYQILDVEKDNYARHGIAVQIPGTDHYLCIATYDNRPRLERQLKHLGKRLLSALSRWDEGDLLPLQVVIRRSLVEN